MKHREGFDFVTSFALRVIRTCYTRHAHRAEDESVRGQRHISTGGANEKRTGGLSVVLTTSLPLLVLAQTEYCYIQALHALIVSPALLPGSRPDPLLRSRRRNTRAPILRLRFVRKQLHAELGCMLRLDLGKDGRSRFCFDKAKNFDRFLIRHPLQPDCRVL